MVRSLLQNEGWLKSTKPRSDAGSGAMAVYCVRDVVYRTMVRLSDSKKFEAI